MDIDPKRRSIFRLVEAEQSADPRIDAACSRWLDSHPDRDREHEGDDPSPGEGDPNDGIDLAATIERMERHIVALYHLTESLRELLPPEAS
jgi:hypothetical protein